jgi:hypothetical protein
VIRERRKGEAPVRSARCKAGAHDWCPVTGACRRVGCLETDTDVLWWDGRGPDPEARTRDMFGGEGGS